MKITVESTKLDQTAAAGPTNPSVGDAAQETVDYTRLATVAAILCGIAFRVIQYGSGRSLWVDEVLVARTLTDHSFSELLNPALWGAAPPGFLLLTKLATAALGTSDYVLRLIPLVAGIASLFLFLALARRCLPAPAVPLALGLFALSPFLIYYSSELKPYSSDAAATLVLLLLSLRLHDRGVTWRRAGLWCVGVLFAAAFSLPALFVGGGATVALAFSAWRAGNREAFGRLMAVLAGWAAVLAAAYLFFLQGGPAHDYARGFWRGGFMPLPPRSLEDLTWFPRTFLQVFRDPLGVMSDRQSEAALLAPAAGMLVFVLGCARMLRRRQTELLVLVAPIVATLLASGLMLYPFGGSRATAGRVLLFLAPIFFLIMGAGAYHLWTRLRGIMRTLAVPVLGLLFVPALAWALVALPFPRTETRPLLEYLQEERRPGDLLYVHYDIRRAFEYYAERHGLGDLPYVPGVCARDEPARYLDALSTLRGAPRVWVLFADGRGAGLFSEKGIMLDYLEHVGTRLDDQVSVGAALYLYDLRPRSGSEAPFEARLPVISIGAEDGCDFWR